MGDLRDQLKKANLVSKKDQKRLEHEQRVRRKKVGREGLEQEQKDRQREIEKQRAETRERDRAREAETGAERKIREEIAACEAILETEVRRPEEGRMTWFFEVEDGRLPHFRLSDADKHQLDGGHQVVIRTGKPGTHVYGLLASQHAERVRKHFPDRIVWTKSGERSA